MVKNSNSQSAKSLEINPDNASDSDHMIDSSKLTPVSTASRSRKKKSAVEYEVSQLSNPSSLTSSLSNQQQYDNRINNRPASKSRSAPSTPKFHATVASSPLSNEISLSDDKDGSTLISNFITTSPNITTNRIKEQLNSSSNNNNTVGKNKVTIIRPRRHSNNNTVANSNSRMAPTTPISINNSGNTIPRRIGSPLPSKRSPRNSDSGSPVRTRMGIPLLSSYNNGNTISASHLSPSRSYANGGSNSGYANYGSIANHDSGDIFGYMNNSNTPILDNSSVRSDSFLFSQSGYHNQQQQQRNNHRGVLNRIGKSVKNTLYKFNNSSSIYFYDDSEEQIENLSRQGLMKYYFPILDWWPDYTLLKFFKDIIAGISLASFQIPLCLSYATSLAHVSPTCGLYGLIISPLVYFIFGTVPQMIVGPEGAISLIVGQAVEPIMKHNKELASTDLVVIISAVSGGALLGAGLLKFGFLENVLNGSLLSGFISGVGLVMIINALLEQMKLSEEFQKLPGHHHSPVDKIKFLFQHLKNAHLPTVFISVVCFLMIFCTRLLKKRLNKRRFKHLTWFTVFFPEILVTVIIATFVSFLMKFDTRYGVEVLGEVSSGSVKFSLPLQKFQKYHLEDFFYILLSSGYVTAILGFFESTTASKSMAMNLDLSISTDRELVALGMINLIGACFSALPSFGGYGRSKVNLISGAQSTMAGAVMGVVTLLMTLYLLPSIYYLPKCLLSVISMIIGISLLDEAPSNVAYHWRCSGYNEIATFLITITATFFSSIELGITLGCGYSLLRVIKDSSQSRIQLELFDEDTTILVTVPEPLTFTNTEDFRMRLMKLLTEKHDLVLYMIIDLSKMKYIDSSALQMLDHTLCKIIKNGRIWRLQVCGAAHLSEKAKSRFESAEFFKLYDVVGLSESVADARRAITRDWYPGADELSEDEEDEQQERSGAASNNHSNGYNDTEFAGEGANGGAYGDDASLYSRSYLQL